MEPEEEKQSNLDTLINNCYIQIKNYYTGIDRDNFAIHLKGKYDAECAKLPLERKAMDICNFVKQMIQDKENFLNNTKYELINLDENFERLFNLKNSSFNQENFKNLINKCKMFMKSQREDALYIEKLKQTIIQLESEKHAIIEGTKEAIESMKSNQLMLIDKIEKLSKETDKMGKEKMELMRKTEEIHRKVQENHILKNEIEKTKSGFSREKNRIVINKDREIIVLKDRIKFTEKFEKETEKERKEKFRHINMNNELKIEVERLKNENNLLSCEVSKLEAFNHTLNESYAKLDITLKEAKKTIHFLVNSPPFKDIKNVFKSIDQLNTIEAFGTKSPLSTSSSQSKVFDK